ncbi:flagellar biosynthetic protein FliO [Variovorax paradoxus]|uniref:Flagellar biosynthesis protein FliO n=1 Tax=Variovorax paradoxus TaxID=34073 RepID=A0A6I6HIX1_VARPD|nr:flagellar biosynthetic protein FliO [Variovorax paradoxus]QGW82257.1 hypothetical protein GOQ09_11995 [Variovorax paradoxus]
MDAGAKWQPRIGACKSSLVCGMVAAGLLLAVPPIHAQSTRDSGNAVALSGGTSLPSSIPVKRGHPNDAAGSAGDRWWIAILVAGGLLAGALAVARRKSSPARRAGGASWLRFGGLLDTASSREIERVSSTRLSSGHSLHVVVWGGRRLLLGCTAQSIQLLAETSTPEQEPSPEPVAGSTIEALR